MARLAHKVRRWMLLLACAPLACCGVMVEQAGGSSPEHFYKSPTDSNDPIGALAAQMGHIVGDLGNIQTDKPVQISQHEVLTSLDSIIKELEKQTKGGGSGSNPNPTKPMQHSTLAKGPGGQGPLHDAASGTRVWGQLPAKEREQILQSQTEGFPPGYEAVLSSYYSRLAHTETGTAAGGQVAGPATQPGTP